MFYAYSNIHKYICLFKWWDTVYIFMQVFFFYHVTAYLETCFISVHKDMLLFFCPSHWRLHFYPTVQTCLVSCFSHVWLCATPWTVACQAPLSMGILQARIEEWVAMPSSRGSSLLGIEPEFLRSPALAGEFFTTNATWEAPYRLPMLYLTDVPFMGICCCCC